MDIRLPVARPPPERAWRRWRRSPGQWLMLREPSGWHSRSAHCRARNPPTGVGVGCAKGLCCQPSCAPRNLEWAGQEDGSGIVVSTVLSQTCLNACKHSITGISHGLRHSLLIYLFHVRLGPGEIEIGLGIHGEPGTSKVPAMPADELVERMLAQITSSKHFGGPVEPVSLYTPLEAPLSR